METLLVIIMELLRAMLHTTTAIMDTSFLEIISEYVKPIEHGLVNNQDVVSAIAYDK